MRRRRRRRRRRCRSSRRHTSIRRAGTPPPPLPPSRTPTPPKAHTASPRHRRASGLGEPWRPPFMLLSRCESRRHTAHTAGRPGAGRRDRARTELACGGFLARRLGSGPGQGPATDPYLRRFRRLGCGAGTGGRGKRSPGRRRRPRARPGSRSAPPPPPAPPSPHTHTTRRLLLGEPPATRPASSPQGGPPFREAHAAGCGRDWVTGRRTGSWG